ncbi:type III-B CRISPR-associated protein Cas10/Cmr2 [Chitinispirillales bacterium ANBcel5]|uniref:type III-B CRISPR-associated protein Cas10/Cmr2 n=1 Tax=Cellulosispirillum alkaliphilum TaxID=3039283 RepID=UPI002A574E0A|nr:type III-B CRISPR-associated protein Cas10/Cmr2 [Chitinispirillales bacterium ANBcel5]
MNEQFLLLISIGPVQDFISSARKLRDLWFGSNLLSELSKRVAKSLHSQGCELIFPAIENVSELEENSELIVANKILTSYSGTIPPKVIIANAKKEWRKMLESIADDTKNELRNYPLKVNEKVFDAQISDIGEFFGVWAQIGSDSYYNGRQSIERLLSGRKKIREFEAPKWNGKGIPKNSLDGYRETVFTNKINELKGLLKKNEKLDAIGFIKRFYPIRKKAKNVEQFEDLADIAIAPWLKAIKKGTKKPVLDTFESIIASDTSNHRKNDKLSDNPILSELYYVKKSDLNDYISSESVENAWKKLRELRESAGEPTKYACILLGDGDNMGKVIGEIKDMKGHKTFSRSLSEFAAHAKKIVSKNEGSLVYAGGDDVLAYAPMHTALLCANELRKAFFKQMKKVIIDLGLKCQIPTFSIGIAIVHYSEPLGNALNLARETENIAKTIAGKDALAIILKKRSGSPTQIYGKWDNFKGEKGIVEDLHYLVQRLRDKNCETLQLSSRLAYQLRTARIKGGDSINYHLSEDNKVVPENAQSALVQAIFQHKDGGEELVKEVLFGRTSIKCLADELIIAKHFASLPINLKENTE